MHQKLKASRSWTAAMWLAPIAGVILTGVVYIWLVNTPRATIATDAVDRIHKHAQEIVDTAFPGRIGAAPFQRVQLEGVRRDHDGYRAIVTLYYTNIVKDDNYMMIELRYDADGEYHDARIHKCNDRWASPITLVDLATR